MPQGLRVRLPPEAQIDWTKWKLGLGVQLLFLGVEAVLRWITSLRCNPSKTGTEFVEFNPNKTQQKTRTSGTTPKVHLVTCAKEAQHLNQQKARTSGTIPLGRIIV